MANAIIKVDNMTCSACESKIEIRLKKKDGITEIKANHIDGIVKVSYNEDTISKEEIIYEIEKLNYNVIKEENEKNKNENLKIFGILIILAIIYLVIKNTIGFNFIPKVNQSMSYAMLFVIGLITSLHCMAMCGGINISQCAINKDNTSNNGIKEKIQPSLLYNLGRVISYTILGGIIGAVGSVFSLNIFTQGLIQMFAGTLILIMGLKMFGIIPALNKFNIRMPKFVANSLYSGNKKRGPFVVRIIKWINAMWTITNNANICIGNRQFNLRRRFYVFL